MPRLVKATDIIVFEDGTYDAELFCIEDDIGEFGPFWKWRFQIRKGAEWVPVTGVTSKRFGPRAKARQWAEAILNRKIQTGAVIDLDSLERMRCQLVLFVFEHDDGALDNRVAEVLPAGPREEHTFRP